jgi:hypothetical protein
MTLTNAQRQARWRERREARIAELEALAACRPAQQPQQSQPAPDALAKANDRIAELEKEVARLNALGPDLPKTFEELVARSDAIKEAERKMRADARAEKAAKIVADADPELTREDLLVRVADLEKLNKGLRTQIKNERAKTKHLIGKGYLLSKGDKKKLLACLHPDRVTDAAEKKKLEAAFQIVGNIPSDSD